MNIKNELSKNQNVLLVMTGAEYNSSILNVMKSLSGKNVCYVTINKTFDSLREIFKKKKINTKNVVFVDAISKSIKNVPDQSDQVYYISSPGALTELSLVISKFLKHEFDYIVFDSITNLSIYNKPQLCTSFLSNLMNKIKGVKTKSVFYAIASSGGNALIDNISPLFDKIVGSKSK